MWLSTILDSALSSGSDQIRHYWVFLYADKTLQSSILPLLP